jgi:hypothetical protein
VIGEIPSKDNVEKLLRQWLLRLLGNTGLAALEYQLRKALGKNPYQAFYENPNRLYNAFRAIFGERGRSTRQIQMR